MLRNITTSTDSVNYIDLFCKQAGCCGDTRFALLLTQWNTEINSVNQQAVVVTEDLNSHLFRWLHKVIL